MTMNGSYTTRARHATDDELACVVSFFDVPELRRYYQALLDDIRNEQTIRTTTDERNGKRK